MCHSKHEHKCLQGHVCFHVCPQRACRVGVRVLSQDLKEGRNLYEMTCVIAEMNQKQNADFTHSQVSFPLRSRQSWDLKQQSYQGDGKSQVSL